MSTKVNESLSRGLAKRACRELTGEFFKRINSSNPQSFGGFKETISLAYTYKYLVKDMRHNLGDALIFQTEIKHRIRKNTVSYFFYWESDKNRFYVNGFAIRYGDGLEYSQRQMHFLTVSKHSIERIFERTNSLETRIVDNELFNVVAPAILIARDFKKNNYALEQDNILIPTKNGAAISKVDNNKLLIIVTWLSDNELNQARKFEKQKILESSNLDIRVKRDSCSDQIRIKINHLNKKWLKDNFIPTNSSHLSS
jgi:hypothetical protein